MAGPTPQDSPEEARGTHDRMTGSKGIPPRRIPASGTLIPKDELTPDPLIGRADVRSVAPSGREVYDPENRSLDRGIDYESAATRRTGAGGGSSIDIEVPLLGHTEHEKEKKRKHRRDDSHEIAPAVPAALPKKFHNYPGPTYADSTFRELEKIRDLIHKEAAGETALARAIAGAYAAEFEKHGIDDAWQDRDVKRSTQYQFRRDELLLKGRWGANWLERSFYERPGTAAKLNSLLLNDIGPANFRVATALYLIRAGWLQLEISDPKNYYPEMAKQLVSREGAVKAVAAYLRFGRSEFEQREFGQHVKMEKWAYDFQAAVLVLWYRQGPNAWDNFEERWNIDPNVLPDLGDEDGYMHNRKRIVRAIH